MAARASLLVSTPQKLSSHRQWAVGEGFGILLNFSPSRMATELPRNKEDNEAEAGQWNEETENTHSGGL